MPGVSRTCTVMINSLENPIHINLLEELQKRQVRLRLKQARPAETSSLIIGVQIRPTVLGVMERPARLRLTQARPAVKLAPS